MPSMAVASLFLSVEMPSSSSQLPIEARAIMSSSMEVDGAEAVGVGTGTVVTGADEDVGAGVGVGVAPNGFYMIGRDEI